MQDMQPDNMNQEPIGAHGSPDREGAMAKADLYKLANYSLKLFKKMKDDDQLEGWVQAKITKAADYIASVYHYLEYEMEFSEYGAKLDSSEMYSEGQKLALKNKLMEAKEKVASLKKLQAEKKTKEEKVKESFDDKAKVGDTKKTATGELTKTSTGVVHKNTSYHDDGEAEDKSGKGKKSHAKAQSAAEKKDRAPAQKQSKTGTWGMKDGAKFDNRKTNESKDKGDMDHDGANEPDDEEYKQNKDVAIKKAMGKKEKKVDEASTCNETPKGESCPVHGMKECGMYEAGEPSAGMTKKEKSSTVKAAKAGKDIGKPGKNFGKVAAAAKKGGAKDPEAVAAAAMWKNKAKSLKESLDAMSETAMDQMDSATIEVIKRAAEIDPQGLKTATEQGPEQLATFLQGILSKIEKVVDSGATPQDTNTSSTEPKDMPGLGDTEAEEGVVTDFVAGGANAIGQQVGGVVRGVKQAGQEIKQFGTDVANAAKAGYNQATGNSYTASAKMGAGVQGMPAADPTQTTPAYTQPADPAAPKQPGISKQDRNLRESVETIRMREQLARLNQHENIVVKESNEVDQIRALTKRLLG